MSILEDCDCADWKVQIKVIDQMIDIAFIHGFFYPITQFLYCPWCGKKRKVITDDEPLTK